MPNKKEVAAIIIGGFLNGYSIISELYSYNIRDIILISYGKQHASYSNKIIKNLKIDTTSFSLLEVLKEINREYNYLILFPTDDLQLTNISSIYGDIKEFAYIPFNNNHLNEDLNKFVQYKYCEKLSIPYPKTLILCKACDLDNVNNLDFPLIIKPISREDIFDKSLFRNKIFMTYNDLLTAKKSLLLFMEKGVQFIISEIIPGKTDSTILAYVGCRTHEGEIIGEWGGTKLSQSPNSFGVFSSASNKAPDVIFEYGSKLLNAMDLYGICEPEFKYDYRDRQYKLMEINLRPMMWNHVGFLSNVPLHYLQWLEANKLPLPSFVQNNKDSIHLVYLSHEVLNLIFRKSYYRIFKQNLFSCDRRKIAFWDIHDLKPFIYDFMLLTKKIIGGLLKYKKYAKIYNQ